MEFFYLINGTSHTFWNSSRIFPKNFKISYYAFPSCAYSGCFWPSVGDSHNNVLEYFFHLDIPTCSLWDTSMSSPMHFQNWQNPQIVCYHQNTTLMRKVFFTEAKIPLLLPGLKNEFSNTFSKCTKSADCFPLPIQAMKVVKYFYDFGIAPPFLNVTRQWVLPCIFKTHKIQLLFSLSITQQQQRDGVFIPFKWHLPHFMELFKEFTKELQNLLLCIF